MKIESLLFHDHMGNMRPKLLTDQAFGVCADVHSSTVRRFTWWYCEHIEPIELLLYLENNMEMASVHSA